MNLLNFITTLLMFTGVLFYFAGTIGLLRFPDVFSRLHGLTKADNLGLGLIIFGALLQAPSLYSALQLLLIWLLTMASSAACCFLIARYAHKRSTTTSNSNTGDQPKC
jgi:multicomponent Na+:H+ antiporter subunit G